MSDLIPMPLIAALLLMVIAGLAFHRWRAQAQDTEAAQRARLDRLDTVSDWPPEGTRLLGSSSRKAHASLVEALPECTIFAQVPVARFVRVPRRQSYSEWITRVGHMAVDFLICDKSTMALGVVVLQGAGETTRAQKRRERIQRVLKHAGIKMFVWRDDAVPSASAARTMIIQSGPLDSETDAGAPSSTFESILSSSGRHLPLPEITAPVPLDDGGDPWGGFDRPRDPPPSTWFDDLDSGPGALAPAAAAPRKASV